MRSFLLLAIFIAGLIAPLCLAAILPEGTKSDTPTDSSPSNVVSNKEYLDNVLQNTLNTIQVSEDQTQAAKETYVKRVTCATGPLVEGGLGVYDITRRYVKKWCCFLGTQ
eukprot:TRINITY_DN9325_c0_g1_i1.p1 TRINITY_DN9325_c0_g1~~TRINITY_DN9325_c0_g1_i1.p1  ORF type:complete len:110 (-),score=8.30 TRINITY_DN9325_c0_g1_i1:74-403(-)